MFAIHNHRPFAHSFIHSLATLDTLLDVLAPATRRLYSYSNVAI